jgi:hypothetical protein
MRIVAEVPAGDGRAVGCGDAVREAMGNSTKLPKETNKDNREEEVGRKPARGRIREAENSFRVAGCRVVRFVA